MTISEVKTKEDMEKYCRCAGTNDCKGCPINQKCNDLFDKEGAYDETDFTTFYNKKHELIIVYNRKAKLEKLLA